MEKYINGLIQEIEQKVLIRWYENTPHHYREGDEYFEVETPPENWVKPKPLSPEIRLDLHFKELDDWETGAGEMSMYQLFDFMPETFPPAEQLSPAQLDKLLTSLYRLWIAYNFYPEPPESFPKHQLYILMCSYMHEPSQLHNQSATVVDFCGCYPPDCPFGIHCQCFDDDEIEIDECIPLLNQKNSTN